MTTYVTCFSSFLVCLPLISMFISAPPLLCVSQGSLVCPLRRSSALALPSGIPGSWISHVWILLSSGLSHSLFISVTLPQTTQPLSGMWSRLIAFMVLATKDNYFIYSCLSVCLPFPLGFQLIGILPCSQHHWELFWAHIVGNSRWIHDKLLRAVF